MATLFLQKKAKWLLASLGSLKWLLASLGSLKWLKAILGSLKKDIRFSFLVEVHTIRIGRDHTRDDHLITVFFLHDNNIIFVNEVFEN